MPKLVLVDGSSYLYRAFHALPDLRTSRGEPTGAIRGVISMLRRLIEDGKPDYFAVVFDAPGKTFRDDLYPEYKANRSPMPDALAAQIAPLHELIRVHGWPILMIEGVEADDVIGTLARQAEQLDIDTLISTGDKDLAQLITPRVTLVNTMSNEILDMTTVVDKFAVRADQLLDYLALIGDSIDNIPGVPKVGPKTAARWLAEHGTLDDVMANAGSIGGAVGENLRAALTWLPQGKRLLTVKTDCTLPFAPHELVIQPHDADKLRELYERFEFRSWLKDSAQNNAEVPPVTVTQDKDVEPEVVRQPIAREYEAVLDDAAFERMIDEMQGAELVSFDTETTGLDPMEAQIVGLSFSFEPGRASYIPLTHRYAGVPSQLPIDDVLRRLKPWFEDPTRKKIGQNVKYDQHVLANYGVALAGVAHDTLLQSYVLESQRSHDMDSLAWRHLGVKTISYADVAGKGAGHIGFDQVSIDKAAEYSGEDVDIALQLHGVLYQKVQQNPQLDFIYSTIEMPTREVLFRMEREGVLIDASVLAAQSRTLGERLMILEDQAYREAGQPFNLGSPTQLGAILFDKMKLPAIKKTATGKPSTDEDVLQQLAADYPLPRLLLEHRALSKLKSTYTDKLPQMVNARTGRVHTCFGQATAVTGRLASTDPNLQNIPIRTVEGRRIREAFVAPPGHTLISADYSQIELRIMAHLSGDPSLLKAFAAGEDIHRATAADIFGVPIDDVTSEQRRYIKAVNFGLIYGMSAFGLAAQLGIERGAAAQFIEKYFIRYPGVAEYMQRTRELARTQGYVETVFGRRLWLPDINAGGGPRRQAAERAAINAPMQGTAADLIKLAMIEVQAWLDSESVGAKLVLQVHDELVLEAPVDHLDRLKAELALRMAGVAQLRVPLVVDVGSGPNWEQAH
ncbi:MAG: DNA polymerase I [Betaproteobacteria bacterium]|nr:MAG: DNA polymerase I [Betaproteobacteria bacterium]